MRPLREIVTAFVDRTYLPVNERVPRTWAKADVPPITFAWPENDTSFESAPAAHAFAPCVEIRIEPDRPLSVALPLNATHVELVSVPCPEPVSVLGPMGLPRPARVAVPEAVVPLTAPTPVPAYEAAKRCVLAVHPAGERKHVPTIERIVAHATRAPGTPRTLTTRIYRSLGTSSEDVGLNRNGRQP